MPEPGVSETTVAATLVIDMLHFLERRGHASADVCHEAGLDPAIVGRPDERVPGSRMAVLWDVAVARTRDPLVAVHMADEFHPAALDILGYVVLTCRTIGDALTCLVRYATLLNDGLRVTLAHDGPRSIVCLEFVDGHRTNALLTESRYVADSMWIGLARQLRSLTGEPIIPLEVRFRHTTTDERTYRRVLRAPVVFGAREDTFILARTDLARALPSANPALFTVFEQHAESLLDGLSTRGSIVSRVSQVIAARLKGRVPPVGEVASELAMSARNLQRALQAEQRTYQQVLDEVRSGLARRYLSNDANSVSQVAFLLGFSEAAAFHRAFKKWTGTTPAAARR